MRTIPAGTFKPIRHLQPFLAFLNREDAAQRRKLDRVTVDLVRAHPLGKGRRERLKLMASLRRGLRSRVGWSGVGMLTVPQDFLNHTRRYGLDFERSLRTWWQVWSVLQQASPLLPRRIAQCPWCGRIFYRYRLNADHCSAVCGLAVRLLAGQEADVAGDLVQTAGYLEAFEKRPRSRYGELDALFSKHSRDLFKFILQPLVRRIEPPVVFPESVTDPEAFVVIWRFLFENVPELRDRIATCASCSKLFWRYRHTSRTCSRKCQMRRYRTRRRHPRS